ncbi:MAG: hypothetical protein K5769_11495 [Pseudobutyrivibrio sp.]|nr:hypothetical protein [Pseudobutyrivibrio sp.]
MSFLNLQTGNRVHLKSTATHADGRIIPYDTKQDEFEVSGVDENSGLVKLKNLTDKTVDNFLVRAKDIEKMVDGHNEGDT